MINKGIVWGGSGHLSFIIDHLTFII
jgi:hypothetical protein